MAAGKWKWNANELSTHRNAQCTDLAIEGDGNTRLRVLIAVQRLARLEIKLLFRFSRQRATRASDAL